LLGWLDAIAHAQRHPEDLGRSGAPVSAETVAEAQHAYRELTGETLDGEWLRQALSLPASAEPPLPIPLVPTPLPDRPQKWVDRWNAWLVRRDPRLLFRLRDEADRQRRLKWFTRLRNGGFGAAGLLLAATVVQVVRYQSQKSAHWALLPHPLTPEAWATWAQANAGPPLQAWMQVEHHLHLLNQYIQGTFWVGALLGFAAIGAMAMVFDLRPTLVSARDEAVWRLSPRVQHYLRQGRVEGVPFLGFEARHLNRLAAQDGLMGRASVPSVSEEPRTRSKGQKYGS
jgi:hypothetical protein